MRRRLRGAQVFACHWSCVVAKWWTKRGAAVADPSGVIIVGNGSFEPPSG
jgi:hypothetical protein